MTNERDWPFEKLAEGTVRPWFLSATGYLFALFEDASEGVRARQGLLDRNVPDGDLRLYDSEQILSLESRRSQERSPVTKAVAALTVDAAVRDLYLETARTGGSALWVFAPTDDAANRFIRLLADYDYVLLRHYGEKGVVDFRPGAD
jgi:hypothetical protein